MLDVDRNAPAEEGRYFELEKNGIKFSIETKDPYGMKVIKIEGKKTVPVGLDGLYTSNSQAVVAIENYLNSVSTKSVSAKGQNGNEDRSSTLK